MLRRWREELAPDLDECDQDVQRSTAETNRRLAIEQEPLAEGDRIVLPVIVRLIGTAPIDSMRLNSFCRQRAFAYRRCATSRDPPTFLPVLDVRTDAREQFVLGKVSSWFRIGQR